MVSFVLPVRLRGLLRSTVALLVSQATLALAAPGPAPVPATLSAKEIAQGFSDRVVLAKPRAEHRSTADAAEAREGVRVRRTFARFGDLRVIELDGSESVAVAIARLQATGRYEFVEPSYLQKPSAIPNDQLYGAQWYLNNTGQNIGFGAGTTGADIKAQAAWDVINDASGVVVAIVDTGARLVHPELVPNLWRNPAPTFGDVHGARFTSGTGVATNGDPTDDDGHGTRMAGIIGSAGNNGALFTGVAWKVQMMILKNGFDAAGNAVVADTVACFDYAIRQGAKVINCSFGEAAYSAAVFTALKAARDAGVIVVCAAGNDGRNTDAQPFYPAAYALDNIVTTGMTDNNDAVSSRSNFGAGVDLFVPGVNVPALNWTNDTGVTVVTGTSPTAAIVTGSFALLKTRFPGDTYRQLINRLLRTTDRKPEFAGKVQTGGRLNLFAAVTSTSNRPMNDDFATRAVVAGDLATIRSNNVGATAETGESALAGVSAAATLWWEWTAPSAGPVTIDTAGSEYDTVLAVYTGTALRTLTTVAGNDDAPGRTTSRVAFAATAGTTYLFAVGGKGSATGLTLVNLTRQPPPADLLAPSILAQPAAQAVTVGSPVTFTASVSGSPAPAFQWRKDGTPISGANGATLTLAAATAADAGTYSVVVTNAAGSVVSTASLLTVNAVSTGLTSRLSNLSVRTAMAAGQTLIVGFSVTGGRQSLVVRGIGPTLASFGVTDAMADPRLELYDGSTLVGGNDDWGNSVTLSNAFASVGAFPLVTNSRDAALQQSVDGTRSVHLKAPGAGATLVELYAIGSGNTPRLVNVSARNQVGTGDNILIMGFFIDGTGTKRVLIRAVGPALADFGVTSALADPKIELYRAEVAAAMATNDNWDAALAPTFNSVAAFALTPGSRDAALVAALAPGSYTVQVSGVRNTTGEALVEIYELP